jgi:hypothetical protein
MVIPKGRFANYVEWLSRTLDFWVVTTPFVASALTKSVRESLQIRN